MKIRTGFVSNSSTSSFVLMVTSDLHDDYIKQSDLSPYIKAAIESMASKQVFAGKTVLNWDKMTTMDGSSSLEYVEIDFDGDVGLDKYGYENDPSGALSNYTDGIQKFAKDSNRNDEVFTNSIDM